jgi:hypothetical protein
VAEEEREALYNQAWMTTLETAWRVGALQDRHEYHMRLKAVTEKRFQAALLIKKYA